MSHIFLNIKREGGTLRREGERERLAVKINGGIMGCKKFEMLLNLQSICHFHLGCPACSDVPYHSENIRMSNRRLYYD